MRRRTLLRGIALVPPSLAVAALPRPAPASQAAARLVTDDRSSYPLLADRDRLYWAAREEIRSVSKRGGKPTAVVTGNVNPLALYQDRLVFEELPPAKGSSIEPETIIKTFKTGAPAAVTTLATGRRMIHGAIADESGIYFHELQSSSLMLLFHLPWSGGKAREVAEVANEPGALATDATHVYWGHIDGAVYAVAKQGGVPEVVGAGESSTGALAVDDRFVYFTCSEAGTLSRAPKHGGKTVELAIARPSTGGQGVDLRGQLDAVVLHGPHVYYVDNDIYARNAAVRRVPKAGGRAESVIERSGCTIEDLLTDGSQWFWVEKIEKSGEKTRYPIMSASL
jgi:hypothetical protein